jgi:predicted GNAT family N-acyltransferase
MEIKRIDNLDDQLLTQIYQLRVEVWNNTSLIKKPFSNGLWTDEHDDHAMHWAVVSDNKVLAAARLSIHKTLEELPYANLYMDSEKLILPPIASMNRLVIHPVAQGKGLSKEFDAVLINQARKTKCCSMVVPLSELTKYRKNSLLKQWFKQIAGGINDERFGKVYGYVLKLT